MRIMGIDPGLYRTGFAIIYSNNNSASLVKFGIIKPSKNGSFAISIKHIIQQVEDILTQYNPDVSVVEVSYVGINMRTAVICARTTGAIISHIALLGYRVVEMTPLQIKKAVSGYGYCKKADIARIVSKELNIREEVPYDVTDACACALAYISESRWDMLINR